MNTKRIYVSVNVLLLLAMGVLVAYAAAVALVPSGATTGQGPMLYAINDPAQNKSYHAFTGSCGQVMGYPVNGQQVQFDFTQLSLNQAVPIESCLLESGTGFTGCTTVIVDPALPPNTPVPGVPIRPIPHWCIALTITPDPMVPTRTAPVYKIHIPVLMKN